MHVTSLHKNESFILELEALEPQAWGSTVHDLITWVHSRFNLKRFVASTQWQLMSITQLKLRIHSRILVFDTVSHYTQSISLEGWPQTSTNIVYLPRRSWRPSGMAMCAAEEKVKITLQYVWFLIDTRGPDTLKGPGVHHLHIVGTCLLVWGGRVYIHWNTWRIQLSAFMYWYQDMNWVSVECLHWQDGSETDLGRFWRRFGKLYLGSVGTLQV